MARTVDAEKLSDLDIFLLHDNFIRHIISSPNPPPKAAPSLLDSMDDLVRNTKRRKFNNLLLYSNNFIEEEVKEIKEDDTCKRNCFSACSMFEPSIASNVYICKTSGRLHYCTHGSCDSLQTTSESRYCLITGTSYKLDIWVVLPTHNELCDFSNQERIYKTQASITKQLVHEQRVKDELNGCVVRKAPNPKHPKRAEAVVFEDIKSPPTPTIIAPTVVPVVKKRVNAPVNTESLSCVARKFICALIPTLSSDEAGRISALCVHYWSQIIKTKYYAKIRGRYKFLAHCAALIYKGMQGMKMGNTFIVKREPSLYLLLPSSKNIERFGVKKNAYTTSSRHMKESLRELFLATQT